MLGLQHIGKPSTHCHLQQVPHNINFREKKPKPSKKKAEGCSTEEGSGVRGRVARFRYFEDIYGYSGVCRWLGQDLDLRMELHSECTQKCLSPGFHLWTLTSLASGDWPRSSASAPYGH